jgi:hypothetical protein
MRKLGASPTATWIDTRPKLSHPFDWRCAACALAATECVSEQGECVCVCAALLTAAGG